MRSRGFTLLEILVALGVLGVVLGLSLPAVSARLDRGSFDANAERVVGALRLARDEARNAGRPVRVRATTQATGPTAIEWSFQAGADADGDTPPEPEWTALVEIPRGNSVTDQDPAALATTGFGEPVMQFQNEPALAPEFDETGESTLALCVFMPGGEAVVNGPIWLVDAEGEGLVDAERWVGLTISPWTGRITSERGTRVQLTESAAPEPDGTDERFDAWETGPEVAP